MRAGVKIHERARLMACVAASVALVAAAFPSVVAAQDGDAGREDTVIIKAFRTPDALIGNPYIASSDALVSDGVHQLVNEPLFYYDYRSGEAVPWLAESFEYSPDYTEITIHLRDGITWSDGQPFSADDVAFTMEQILAAEAPHRAANIQASVASASVVDPSTVLITLNAANPRFVQTDLASYIYTANFTPLPKHIFEGQDFATFAFYDPEQGWPLGVGPYTLESIGNDRSLLVRNDDWWAAQTGFAELPAPRQVIFSLQGPEDTIINELATNAVDWAGHYGLSPAGADTALAQNPALTATQNFDPCPWSFTVNTTAAPWDDPEMRWALNAVIDKSQFSSLFNTPQEPTPARSTFPEFSGLAAWLDANSDLFETYDTLAFDPEQAAATFEAKGYTLQDGRWVDADGQPLTVRLSIFNSAALGAVWTTVEQLVVQMLNDAGLTVESSPGDFGVVLDARLSGAFDIQSWFECGSVGDPWATFNRYAGTTGTDNPGAWDNATYNDLVSQLGQLAPDDPAGNDLARQALEVFLQELPVIPLAQRPEPLVTSDAYWTGWPTDADPYEISPAWVQSFHNIVLRLQPAGS